MFVVVEIDRKREKINNANISKKMGERQQKSIERKQIDRHKKTYVKILYT